MKKKNDNFFNLAAIIFLALGVLVEVTVYNKNLGDFFLPLIGLKTWIGEFENLHISVYYSIIFYLIAIILSLFSKNTLVSKIVRIFSFIMISLLLISIFFIAKV